MNTLNYFPFSARASAQTAGFSIGGNTTSPHRPSGAIHQDRNGAVTTIFSEGSQ
jgi:hypothetical protein